MYMSVVAPVPGVSVYPELAGARVMITGLTPAAGVDLARSFADHKTRLVLQSEDTSPAMTELGSVLAQQASEIRFFNQPLTGADAVRFTQQAVAAYGGLDAVINLISLSPADMTGCDSLEAAEDLVSAKLLPATLITQVAGNRMSVTWTEGSILNAVLMAPPQNTREQAIASVVRAALAAMTKGEAQARAKNAVRVNALGPRTMIPAEAGGAILTTGPEIASLALHLASKKGRQLSGHVFDAEHVTLRGC